MEKLSPELEKYLEDKFQASRSDSIVKLITDMTIHGIGFSSVVKDGVAGLTLDKNKESFMPFQCSSTQFYGFEWDMEMEKGTVHKKD